MRVSPINHYDGPSLPTRTILDEHPELLKLVPKRWQRNPVVLGALAGVAVLMTGYRAQADNGRNGHVARVAPIFRHGDGRGAFGCMAVNPPVLLSEDEARQVIIEEGKRAGLSITSDAPTLQCVQMPRVVRTPGGNCERKPQPVKLDGQDVKRGILFEFVSYREAADWQDPPACTAYTIDTAEQAERLRAEIAKAAPEGVYATFYDPLVPVQMIRRSGDEWVVSHDTFGEAQCKAGELARENLRKQVRDFIKWLKAQGVI